VAALRASAEAKVEDRAECWFLFRARLEAGRGLTPTSPGGFCVPIFKPSSEGGPLLLNWVFRAAPRRECALFSSRHTSISSSAAFIVPSPPVLDVSHDGDPAPGEAPEASQHGATAGVLSRALSARTPFGAPSSGDVPGETKPGSVDVPFSHPTSGVA
jgi:hypothetical protein